MAVTSWRYGSTATATADGDGRVTNPTYALSADSQWATFTTFAAQRLPTNLSGYLRVGNFGFSAEIPAGATITGVEVECQRSTFSDNGNGYGGGTWIKDQSVTLALTASNFPVGTNRADAGLWTPGAIRQANLEVASTTPRYGGESDLWGQAITRTNAISTNFAVLIQAVGVSDIHLGYVNFVRMRVHYTVGLPARNVTASGAVKAVGGASATQARRASRATVSGSAKANGAVSARQVRRSSVVSANGLVTVTATANSSNAKRPTSATITGSVAPRGAGEVNQVRRTVSATVSGAVSPTASASASMSAKTAHVTANGLVAVAGSGIAGHIRRLSTATATGRVTVSAKATASQSRRNPQARISGHVTVTAKAFVESRPGTRMFGRITAVGSGHAMQIRPDVRLFVDPLRVVVIPAELRTVVVPADVRAITIPADNRSVSVPADQRTVAVPADARSVK